MSYSTLNKRFMKFGERFADTRFAQWLLGVWAFLESSIWFIAPDLLLLPLVAARPKKLFRYISIALGASILGGITYISLISVNPSFWELVLSSTPFVKEYMFVYVNERYDSYGVWGVLWQSFSLFSFKIWTFLAFERGFSWLAFFSLAAISRFARFFLGAGIVVFGAVRARRLLERHAILFFSLFVLVFFTLVLLVE